MRFQHEDFHPANLIIDNSALVGIVDFNRCGWGDPIEDFHKVPMFSTGASNAFARGQILGYLAEGVPSRFWTRYNLYVALSLHPSMVWGLREPKSSLLFFQARTRETVESHDFRDGGPPSWF